MLLHFRYGVGAFEDQISQQNRGLRDVGPEKALENILDRSNNEVTERANTQRRLLNMVNDEKIRTYTYGKNRGQNGSWNKTTWAAS